MRGDHQLRARLSGGRPDPCESHAGGGRADDGAPALAGQCAEDLLHTCAGGIVGILHVPRGTQLPPGHGSEVYRHAPESGECRSTCCKISELTKHGTDYWTRADDGTLELGDARLGELLPLGLGQSGLRAARRARTKRLRQRLCREQWVKSAKYVCHPDERLWQDTGVTRLKGRTASFAWAKA